MKLGIVGCGASGILTWLELLELGVPAHDITLIDPFCDGGALGRQWGAIFSNTTFQQIQTALERYSRAQAKVQELTTKYPSDSRVLLNDLAVLLRSCFQSAFLESHTVQEECIEIQQTQGGWILHTPSQKISVDGVFVCQGGKQRYLDIGKPCIPLEVALDPVRLRRQIQPGNTVCVFGLAHSGTLIIKSLLDLDCKVFAIYKGAKPFAFARDGHYDGIKQESADIADTILSTSSSQLTFVKLGDISTLCKALQRSKWIINATGFEPSSLSIYTKENQKISELNYSPETAEIAPNVYGFGLAYPGVTTVDGKIYKDVSIPSFVDQIRRTLPSILSKNNAC